MAEETILKAGDVVRVKDIERFQVTFGSKIKDRDAEVLWVGPTSNGMNKGRACLMFKKRSGRGKEFKEVMWITDLAIHPAT